MHQVSRDAWEGVLFLQQELQQIEEHLDIGARWTTDSPEYRNASEYVRTRSYQRAVDKLEGLVVQRLFELTKANVSQTGRLSPNRRSGVADKLTCEQAISSEPISLRH